MARFNETVDIRPVQGASYDQTSLINTLEAFSQQKISQGVQQVAVQQAAIGQASLQEGEAPQFKEERFFGSVKSKSYNEGLRAAYVASIDRDNRLEISRIAKENESNLIKFNDEVENYRKSVLNNIDPTAKQLVQDSMDSLISANRIRVQVNEIERRHQENARQVDDQIQVAETDALGFARDGDAEAAAESALIAFAGVDAALRAGFIDESQAAVRKREIERGITEEHKLGGLMRTFDDEGEQAAYNELDVLSKNRPKGFDPEEWDRFIAGAQTELNRKSARLERDAVQSAKQAQIAKDYAAIEARINGDDSQIINPKAADAYYQEKLLPLINGAPEETKDAVVAGFIDALKIVPDSMVQQITNAANSNNPDLLADAARLIDRIDETPGVVNKVPKDQQAYIMQVVDLMQNMDASEAVDLARRATDPKDKARIEAVESALNERVKDDPSVYLDDSRSAFGGMFFDPDVNEVSKHKMAKEYRSMFEGFMRAGSTESQAKKKADKYIRRSWGKTKVLGREEVMKYPPEDYYSIGGDVSWIKPQLMADVREEVFGVDLRAEDVFLMANDRTSRTASAGRPSYAVKVMIDGVFHAIEDNWMPDIQAELDKRKSENVEEAMNRRQQALNRQADPVMMYRYSRGGLYY